MEGESRVTAITRFLSIPYKNNGKFGKKNSYLYRLFLRVSFPVLLEAKRVITSRSDTMIAVRYTISSG